MALNCRAKQICILTRISWFQQAPIAIELRTIFEDLSESFRPPKYQPNNLLFVTLTLHNEDTQVEIPHRCIVRSNDHERTPPTLKFDSPPKYKNTCTETATS
ncbi:hypothetical protein WUBG_03921 [Wuchereria bancrofti]|uniref:Uncharacterized protein n=1 Tax=Wuchereria bancrofti TaxID=6293 RepID=J9F6M6_WUCBA|nr:hypothetical protein WUBG_03921 [Wuchereria bancrofti]